MTSRALLTVGLVVVAWGCKSKEERYAAAFAGDKLEAKPALDLIDAIAKADLTKAVPDCKGVLHQPILAAWHTIQIVATGEKSAAPEFAEPTYDQDSCFRDGHDCPGLDFIGAVNSPQATEESSGTDLRKLRSCFRDAGFVGVLRATHWEAAAATTGTDFKGGSVDARLLGFDGHGAFVCATAIRVESSDQVSYSTKREGSAADGKASLDFNVKHELQDKLRTTLMKLFDLKSPCKSE